MTATQLSYPFLTPQKNFWLSTLASFAVAFWIMLSGGYAFGGEYSVQFASFVAALILLVVILLWRWVIWQDRLPRTGLEAAFVTGIFACLASLAASPDPRQGFWRTGSLIASVVMFYLVLCLLRAGMEAWGMLTGIAAAIALVQAQAIAETIQWYSAWFQQAGLVLPAAQYRYVGILMPSPTLCLANLYLFAVMVAFFSARRPAARLGAAVWLVLYFLAFPFASARSGWLGFAAGGLVMLAWWAWQRRLWLAWAALPKVRRWLTAFGLLLGVGLVFTLGVIFLIVFATHYTHGGDPFGDSGRSVFWNNAFRIWQTSPWLGIGPGRFGLAYLQATTSIPPGFWPIQAHDIFLQILAEFGLVGLAAFLILLLSITRVSIRALRAAAPQYRPWIVALLAGLAAMFVQLLLDDITNWMAVVLPAIFSLAWICAATAERSPATFSFRWVAYSAIAVLALAGFELWAYQPLSNWSKTDLAAGAQLAQESARRDSYFHYYQVQAGLLSAWTGYYQSNPTLITSARFSLMRALQLEPATSWIWADLAVLEFSAGDSASALAHIDRAIALSSAFPAYYLNRADMRERSGQSAAALADYRTALELQPEAANHPFWGSTPLRAQVARLAGLPASPPAPPDPAQDEALIRATDTSRYHLDPGVIFFYDAFVSNRRGVGMLTVPGFIQLTADTGQFIALQRQFDTALARGDCPTARRLAELRQLAEGGFALPAAPPEDPCALQPAPRP